MRGFITEEHLRQAEEEFPGIGQYFDALVVKPGTFLELLAAFQHWHAELDLITPRSSGR